MSENSHASSAAYFDSIADMWDSWHDLESLHAAFEAGLRRFGLQPDERILDVGCGTGNLAAAAARQLSAAGRITAIDLSQRMIDIARAKLDDPRVSWICGPVEHLETSKQVFDRIICFSVWPHLADAPGAARLFWNLLASGGKLHIWHLISRDAVNKIHSEGPHAVNNHLLAPARETAAVLERAGYEVEETQDDGAGYLVTARKG